MFDSLFFEVPVLQTGIPSNMPFTYDQLDFFRCNSPCDYGLFRLLLIHSACLTVQKVLV